MNSRYAPRMRRREAIVGSLATLALAFHAAPTAAFEPTCPMYEVIRFCGEVTGDCKVTASDGLLTLKMAVGQIASRMEADLSLDEVVTAGDALRILRVAVGSSPSTLSCGDQRGLRATATGFYSQDGARDPDGYAVGWYPSGADELRNYLVFDLSAVDGYITSGLLHLSTAPDEQAPYNSSDPSETYTLFDIATPVATLTAGGGMAAFTDLGEGTVYGTAVVNDTLPHVLDFAINSAGLDFLREESGLVALGGAITTLAKGGTGEFIFNSTNATDVRYLVVYVE